MKAIRRITAAASAFVLSFTMLAALPDKGGIVKLPAAAAASEDSAQLTQKQLFDRCSTTYGYDDLGNTDKGVAKQKLYRAIYDLYYELWSADKTLDHDTVNDFYFCGEYQYSALGLTLSDAKQAYYAVKDDVPLFFYASNTILYDSVNGYIAFCVDRNCADFSRRQQLEQKITDYINDMSDATADAETDAMKAVIVHDRLVSELEYATETLSDSVNNEWAHNINGAVENKRGVCECYARTFQLVLNYLGVDNLLVSGVSTHDPDNPEQHMWNTIKLDDGKYYLFDVTWDDTADAGLKFFAKGTAAFAGDHRAYTNTDTGEHYQYAIPDLSASDYELGKIDPALNDFEYKINPDGTATIIGCSLTTADITVPEKIAGAAVTCLNDWLFRGNQTVTSVTLPDTVTIIGKCCFAWCTSLESVKLSSSLKYIGGDAFNNCTSLKSIDLPDGLESIAPGAFFGVSFDDRQITVPKSVTDIDHHSLGYWTTTGGYYYYDNDYSALDPVVIRGFTIYCYENSAAHQYAVNNNINFVLLKEPAPAFVPGDADGDGLVTISDLTALQKNLAGWKVSVDKDAADVTGDGNVSLDDLVMLQKHLAGWKVTFANAA